MFCESFLFDSNGIGDSGPSYKPTLHNQAKQFQGSYFNGSLAAMITHIGGHFVDPSVMET